MAHPVIHRRLHLADALAALLLIGCGRGADRVSPAADGSAPAASTPAASSSPPAGASAAPPAVALDPPPGVSPPSSFIAAKSDKACKAQTADVAAYQTRGDVALGAQGDSLAVTWRVRLAGRTEQQIAFAAFDKDLRLVARPRGVGDTAHDAPSRVFGTGAGWAVVWFDDKGLTFARPRQEPLPPPEIAHVTAVGPDVSGDVALGPWPGGGGLAASPFGADHAQLGLFVFAPAEGPPVKAIGVTHHGKEPHLPAIAATASSTFVAWHEGSALMASRFDAAGKETAACVLAPANGQKRERLSLATTAKGAIASWMEGGGVRTRALDASACPASPVWPAAEGKWATLTSLGETALLAWVATDGRLLAARLGADGAPPARGIDAAEGSAGVKDPPAVVAFGERVAFGWAEAMSPAISTKRISVRILDAACVP